MGPKWTPYPQPCNPSTVLCSFPSFLPFSHKTLAPEHLGCSPLSALIDVVLTVDSIKSSLALASVTVDIVGAGPSILTGFTQTFIHVCLTLIPNKARMAQAGESIHSIYTGASILARI